jgi:methyl-accepting chemotaxis protein
MKKFVSIRTKLIANTMIIISLIFLVVLSSITIMNIRTVNEGLRKSEQNIRNALIAKGNTLASNNSVAMTGMAEDNAFTAIQSLVASTVNDDPDITYGIYMDENFFPWASASSENPSGVPQNNTPLSDELSIWASSLQELGHRTSMHDDEEVIEFAAPVLIEDEIVGWIRYGIGTKSMRDALQDARADGKHARIQIIAVLFSFGVLSLIVSYGIVKRLADKITAPIGSLVESTKTIAQGNYEIPVTSESHDELGFLVEDVDKMRVSIKNLTENLREQERLEREMELR